MWHRFFCLVIVSLCTSIANAQPGKAKSEPAGTAPRGSIVEDQAAKKLIEAGDSRYESDEFSKAVDIWQSVIERYPRSRHRFAAHMKLGDHFLNRDRAYDQARKHFEIVTSEENREEDQRAQATLKMGICFYQARNFGKTFSVMREVIEKFPVSPEVNQAYYYIGLSHFQQGHYSRAITALERVGTALTENDSSFEKVEAGKRLFVKIEDADLAALGPNETIKVKVRTTQGDEEVMECHPVGRNVRVVMGSIQSQLGKPRSGNGKLEVRGDDRVKVTYLDQHTADRQFNRPVLRDITVVGNAQAAIMDGAYSDTIKGAVLGKEMNLQVSDADLDLSDAADKLEAMVEVHREKTPEEMEKELADAKIKQTIAGQDKAVDDSDEPQIERYRMIDRVKITLTEARIERSIEGAATSVAQPVSPASTEPGSALATPDVSAKSTEANDLA